LTTSHTDLFRRRVRDHMAGRSLVLEPRTSLRDLVAHLTATPASAALLVDPDRRIVGIVTEQDVVRRVAFRLDPEAPADLAATRPVLTVREDDLVYRAIGLMRRHGLRHMPVVDRDGRPVGTLDLHAAFDAAIGSVLDDIDRLTHEESFAGLARVKQAQASLALRLLEDAVPAPEIQALLADINNDIYRRVLGLLLAELEGEGRGRPPVAFECIVMGSGGRGESLLFPDQDNGFVLADYPDAAQGVI
jgi:signal-transduction protein with cAMP-binding, CBS, and nucleotidyltransferase domain